MTRILCLVLALAVLVPGIARADGLTLRDVIELRRSGLGDDLLIAVIDADGGPLSLTFGDIQDLKSDGFSERLIAALVRTGSRTPSQAETGAPVVHVQQEVTNVVLPAVVVVAPGVADRQWRRRDDLRPGESDDLDYRDPRHGARESRRRPAQPPPASWVTRQEDGRNVTSTGELRRGAPPAAWVTQREPKVEPRTDDKPKPKS